MAAVHQSPYEPELRHLVGGIYALAIIQTARFGKPITALPNPQRVL
jgi:hypothetical protein